MAYYGVFFAANENGIQLAKDSPLSVVTPWFTNFDNLGIDEINAKFKALGLIGSYGNFTCRESLYNSLARFYRKYSIFNTAVSPGKVSLVYVFVPDRKPVDNVESIVKFFFPYNETGASSGWKINEYVFRKDYKVALVSTVPLNPITLTTMYSCIRARIPAERFDNWKNGMTAIVGAAENGSPVDRDGNFYLSYYGDKGKQMAIYEVFLAYMYRWMKGSVGGPLSALLSSKDLACSYHPHNYAQIVASAARPHFIKFVQTYGFDMNLFDNIKPEGESKTWKQIIRSTKVAVKHAYIREGI